MNDTRTDWIDGAGRLQPAIVPVRCAFCRRLLRRVTLDHRGELMVMAGSVTPDGSQARGFSAVNGKGNRLAARVNDASRDGWDPVRPPARYRFVCAGKSHRLDRPITAGRLRELYECARQSGSTIYLD